MTAGNGCVFCDRVLSDAAMIAYDDGRMVAFPPLQERASNRGHMIVAPRQHVRDLYDLPDRLALPIISALRTVGAAVQAAFGADGVTVRQNSGPPGQDVFHLHFHVIPRYERPDDMAGPWESLDRTAQLETARCVREALAHRPTRGVSSP